MADLQHAWKLCASHEASGVDAVPYGAFCVDLPWLGEVVLELPLGFVSAPSM